MTDLFTPLNPPKRPVGYGNAMFLCDLADNVSDQAMRAKYQAGEYPDLTRHAQSYRAMFGRKAKETVK